MDFETKETTGDGGGQLAAPAFVRKVCLLGTSVSTFQMAPVHDQEWEIWTWGNGLLGLPPRITRYFELHEPRYFLLNNSGHYDLMRTAKFPIRTLYDAPDWPTATKLPRAIIEERFGTELLTSTIAWALACCILEQVSVIGIYGIDAACNDDTPISVRRSSRSRRLRRCWASRSASATAATSIFASSPTRRTWILR